MRRLLIGGLAALALGAGLAPVASADVYGNGGVYGAVGCQGWSGSYIANSTCDSAPYADGSFDRCTYTSVFGFWQNQCVRVFP